MNDNALTADTIFDIGESHCIVESESSPGLFHHIYMISGYCANLKEIVAHANTRRKLQDITELCVLPELDANMRAMYYYIAEAAICKDSWYREMEKPETLENVSEFVKSRTDDSNHLPVPINSITVKSISDKESESDTESIEKHTSDKEDDLALENFVTAIDNFNDKVKLSHAKG